MENIRLKGKRAVPVNMTRFERLAYLSLVLSIAALVLDTKVHTPAMLVFTVCILLAFAALQGGLIWATARFRKDWLRWVYAIQAISGVANYLWTVPTKFAVHSTWFQAITVGSHILDIACVCLLFSAASNPWFRSKAVAC
jgi:hypothetical protein